MLSIDVILITYNRSGDIAECLERLLSHAVEFDRILVVDNGSVDDTALVLARFAEHSQISILRPGCNLGVTGGRNLAIKAAQADIVVCLDDDAYIYTPQPFARIRHYFDSEPGLSLLGFKIENYYTRQVQGKEFPARLNSVTPEEEFLCGYFIGAGWAARREELLAAGGFDENFFSFQEESDLSFRLVNRGGYLKFTPDPAVYHKQSPTGRPPAQEALARLYRNRLAIAYKYLPLRYRLVSGMLWFVKVLLMSRSFFVPLRGWLDFCRMCELLRRERLSASALKYMRSHQGRLWF